MTNLLSRHGIVPAAAVRRFPERRGWAAKSKTNGQESLITPLKFATNVNQECLGIQWLRLGAMGPWHLMSRLQYGCIDAPVKMITHCASRRKTYGAVGACKGNVCGRADVAKAHQSKWAGTEGGGRLPTSPPPSHLLHTDSNPIENTGTMNAPCSKDAWAVSSQPSPLPFGDSQGCGE